MSLDSADLEKFERGLEEADVDKMERILDRIDPERLEPCLVEVDLSRLGRELAASVERMEGMLHWVHEVTAGSEGGKVARSDEPPSYVASSDSDRYHLPGCGWAKRIAPDKRIHFSSSREAQDGGYVPCRVCKPS